MAKVVLLILVAALTAAPGTVAQGSGLPPPPSFSITPQDPVVGTLITFQSTSPDADARTENWTWRFGDGAFAFGPNATHAYDAPGDYFVELLVLYDDGLTGTAAALVAIPSEAGGEDDGSFIPDWLFFVLPFIVGMVLLAFSYFVVSKGQPAIYNYVFFLLFTASGLKSLTEGFAYLGRGTGAGAAILGANEIITYLFAPLFLWFVLVFPRPVTRFLVEGKRGAAALLLAVPFLLVMAFGWLDFESRVNAFNVFVSLLAVAALGLLVYHAWETDSDEERLRIRLLAAVFFLLVLSALVLAGLNVLQSYQRATGDEGAAEATGNLTLLWGLVVGPLLEIVGAGVLVYAILRYQLMGIEKLVVKVTKNGIVAIVIPSIFVTIGNTIELVFETFVVGGFQMSFLIAGFIAAIVMIPVQKWSTFLVHRLFPGALASDEATEARRRMEIYEAQLRYSLLDGALNAKEVQTLQRLQDSIKLRADEFDEVTRRFPRADLGALAAPTTPSAAAPA